MMPVIPASLHSELESRRSTARREAVGQLQSVPRSQDYSNHNNMHRSGISSKILGSTADAHHDEKLNSPLDTDPVTFKPTPSSAHGLNGSPTSDFHRCHHQSPLSTIANTSGCATHCATQVVPEVWTCRVVARREGVVAVLRVRRVAECAPGTGAAVMAVVSIFWLRGRAVRAWRRVLCGGEAGLREEGPCFFVQRVARGSGTVSDACEGRWRCVTHASWSCSSCRDRRVLCGNARETRKGKPTPFTLKIKADTYAGLL